MADAQSLFPDVQGEHQVDTAGAGALQVWVSRSHPLEQLLASLAVHS